MPLYDYEDEIVHETTRQAAPPKRPAAKKQSKLASLAKLLGFALICFAAYVYWSQNHG